MKSAILPIIAVLFISTIRFPALADQETATLESDMRAAEAARSPRWLIPTANDVEISVGPVSSQCIQIPLEQLQYYYPIPSPQEEYELQRLNNWWQMNRFWNYDPKVVPELRLEPAQEMTHCGMPIEAWKVHYADWEKVRGPQFLPADRPKEPSLQPRASSPPWGLSIISIEF